MKTLRRLSFAMIIALAFASCGSKKEIVYVQQPSVQPPQQTIPAPDQTPKQPGTRIITPCYEESRSDKDFYREIGVFAATDKGEARKGALLQANQLLRNRLGGLVNGIAEDYLLNVNSSSSKRVEDMLEEDMTIAVVKILNDADNPCEAIYAIEGNRFEAYYTIEVSKQELVNKMADEIEKNKEKYEEMNLRFKREQFTERAKSLTERYK